MGWITTSQEVKRSLKTTFNVNVLVTIGLDLCTLLANIHAEKIPHFSKHHPAITTRIEPL